MIQPPRLLILSASTGNGHMSAAHAIDAVAKSQGLESSVVDLMDVVKPFFRRWFKGGYEGLVHHSPALWGHLYRGSDRPLLYYQVQTAMDYAFCSVLRPMTQQNRPDWVICVHSLPQPRLKSLRGRLGFRVGIVVTDLYPHRMWLRGDPDRFFVPVEWTRQVLERRQPRFVGRIDVTGIPIAPIFAEPPGRDEACRIENLDPSLRRVLITSGGIGGGAFEEVIQALGDACPHAELTVVCGRNEALARRLASLHTHASIRVFGHVPQDTMARLMAAADLMVGKSGGLTTSEALAMGLPFVVYRPFLIPGQEEGNARFLAEVGAGIETSGLADLSQQVARLLGDPARRETMSAAGRKHAKPHAATSIVNRVVELSERTVQSA